MVDTMQNDELSKIENAIHGISKGEYSVKEYIEKTNLGELIQKSEISNPLLGRSGPVFEDDGIISPERIEIFYKIPIKKDKNVILIMQILQDEEIRKMRTDSLVSILVRELKEHGGNGSFINEKKVWQAKLIR